MAMTEYPWEISEKTKIPSIGEQYAARPELEARLNRALRVKLTTVTAPAGFGKTTLVSEWIRRSRVDAAWVSLNADDGDRLWLYAAHAIDGVIPGFAETMRPFLGGGGGAASPKRFISHLIPELPPRSKPFLLVLDTRISSKAPRLRTVCAFSCGTCRNRCASS